MKTRRKLTLAQRAAKGQNCTLRISGYGGCSGTDTTVLAHAPVPGCGTAKRRYDWNAAFACSKCHDLIDGRVTFTLAQVPTGAFTAAWLRGIFETQKILRDLEIYCND